MDFNWIIWYGTTHRKHRKMPHIKIMTKSVAITTQFICLTSEEKESLSQLSYGYKWILIIQNVLKWRNNNELVGKTDVYICFVTELGNIYWYWKILRNIDNNIVNIIAIAIEKACSMILILLLNIAKLNFKFWNWLPILTDSLLILILNIEYWLTVIQYWYWMLNIEWQFINIDIEYWYWM